MELTEQFIDYRKHLQDILDGIMPDLFVVTSERNLNEDESKINVVVKQLVGTVRDSTADIPYQIDIFTSDPTKVMQIFTAIAQSHNGKPFFTKGKNEDGFFQYLVYEYYKTPVVMDADVDLNLNHYSRVVVYANLSILKDISTVSEIKINNQNIEFTQASLAYIIEAHSNRESGKELNTTRKTTAGFNLTFTLVNRASSFCNTLFLIATGQMSGSTEFNVDIKTTNNLTAKAKMIVQAYTFNCQSGVPVLPATQVTLAYAGESE